MQSFICRFLKFSCSSIFIKYKIVDCHKLYKVTIFIIVVTNKLDRHQKTEDSPEAVAQRCSVKKLFLEISENSQENN